MGKTRYVPESSRVSFILSGLCSEICEAALHSPELPCSRLADIVREAIYQWGLVHMRRERTGGLRLVSADAVASPFGEGRERALYAGDKEANAEAHHYTSVGVPRLLDEILSVAVEDVPAQFESRSEVVNLAIIQWGLAHFELTFSDGKWDFARPLRPRQAFDFDPKATSLSTAVLHPEDLTATSDVFGAASGEAREMSGTMAVPFYRADADLDYMQKILTGRPTHVAVMSEAATNLENEGKQAEEIEEEKLNRLLSLLDSME